jgi:hypothetical protein
VEGRAEVRTLASMEGQLLTQERKGNAEIIGFGKRNNKVRPPDRGSSRGKKAHSEASRQDHCRLTPGNLHSQDHAPELNQPPVWGPPAGSPQG